MPNVYQGYKKLITAPELCVQSGLAVSEKFAPDVGLHLTATTEAGCQLSCIPVAIMA